MTNRYPLIQISLSPDGQANAVSLNGEWLPVIAVKVAGEYGKPTTVTIKMIAMAQVSGGPNGQTETEPDPRSDKDRTAGGDAKRPANKAPGTSARIH